MFFSRKFFQVFVGCLLILLSWERTEAQVLFYEDTLFGGVTGGGYSPHYSAGGTGTFSIYIEPGSTIHKAYLFSGRHGTASPVTVTLNGIPYTFNNTNLVSPTFSSIYGGTGGVHAIDITSNIIPADTNYTLVVPVQPGPSDRFNDFYLYVAYDNSTLPFMATTIFLKNINPGLSLNYNLTFSKPIPTINDVGLTLFCGYICHSGEGDSVIVNGVPIGKIYGPETNSGNCGGPVSNFFYQNNSLYGLWDENPDLAMNGNDLTSNIQTIIPDSSLGFPLSFDPSQSSNFHWVFFVNYGTTCLPPNLSVSNDTTICSGTTLSLSASGAGSYTWSPNPDLSSLTIPNPTTTPTANSTYYVTGANGSCGSETDSIQVSLLPAPIAEAGSDTAFCTGGQQIIGFPPASSYSYSWASIPAGFSSSNPMDTVQPANSTIYYLTVTNDTNNCTTTDSVVLTVNPLPAVQIVPDSGTVCSGQPFTFYVNSALSYLWGPVASIGDSLQLNSLASTQVFVTGTDINGCINNDSAYLEVLPVPVFSVTANPDTICLGDSSIIIASGPYSYLWLPVNVSGDTLMVSPPSTQTFMVVATDTSNLCTLTYSQEIFVRSLPPVSISSSTNLVCEGDSLLLSASGANAYIWEPGLVSGSSYLVFPGLINTYTVTGTDDFSCENVDELTIDVQPMPQINLGTDTSICPQDSILLDAGHPGSTYLWQDGYTGQSRFGFPPGNYTVALQNGVCYFSDSLIVSIFSYPSVNAGPDKIIPRGDQVRLNGSGAQQYYWNPGVFLSCVECEDPVSSPIVNILYYVEGYDSNGCRGMDSVLIEVVEMESLFVPNAFSPNGDFENPVFLTYGLGILTFQMLIYDRWGNLVFEAKDKDSGWDGTLQNGGPAPMGAYVYKISGTWKSEEAFEKVGMLSLIR